MNTVPDLYTPSRSFSTVRQNSSDLFMNLPQAIERHIDNKDAGVILSFSLAYENATSNFKTKKKKPLFFSCYSFITLLMIQ